jgi:hypothetical protein
MAQTLVEASKGSNDTLAVGVIELLTKLSPVLARLPFETIEGNGLTYRVETTRAGAKFYQVGDTWVESTPTTTPATANLSILGGDADVDRFLEKTRSKPNDLMMEAIESKTKEIKETYEAELVYGYLTGAISTGFDGLQYLVRRNGSTAGSTNVNPNTVAVATASGTSKLLSLERMDYAQELLIGGDPAFWLLSGLMLRSIRKYLKGVGAYSVADFGNGPVEQYNGIPFLVSNQVRNNESADLQYGVNEGGTAVYGHNYADTDGGDDDGGTSIFLVSTDSKCLRGIQNGQLEVVTIGDLETKDAERRRIKWYCGIMLQNILGVTKVTGIDADGVVTA